MSMILVRTCDILKHCSLKPRLSVPQSFNIIGMGTANQFVALISYFELRETVNSPNSRNIETRWPIKMTKKLQELIL